MLTRLSAWESDRSGSLSALTWATDAPLVTVMDPVTPGLMARQWPAWQGCRHLPTPSQASCHDTERPACSSASRIGAGRLVEGRVIDDRHRVKADLRGDLGQQLVLSGEVALHVRYLMQGRARVMEGRLRALVRGGGLDVLPDHDD